MEIHLSKYIVFPLEMRRPFFKAPWESTHFNAKRFSKSLLSGNVKKVKMHFPLRFLVPYKTFLFGPWNMKLNHWTLAVDVTNVTLHKKMKFFIKDFFSKCDQIRSLMRIWSHLLKKSLMENFTFCAVLFNSFRHK